MAGRGSTAMHTYYILVFSAHPHHRGFFESISEIKKKKKCSFCTRFSAHGTQSLLGNFEFFFQKLVLY